VEDEAAKNFRFDSTELFIIHRFHRHFETHPQKDQCKIQKHHETVDESREYESSLRQKNMVSKPGKTQLQTLKSQSFQIRNPQMYDILC